MSMVPVCVKVNNRQVITGEDPQEYELITQGEYSYKNGQHYFVYDETEISGMDKVKTVIRVSEEMVAIMRYGALKSEMIFKKGKSNVSQYVTPHGTFKMELQTKTITIDMEEPLQGYIDIGYTLVMQSTVESVNHITIKIGRSLGL